MGNNWRVLFRRTSNQKEHDDLQNLYERLHEVTLNDTNDEVP